MSAHVLYLSYDGLTDPLGGSQVLPYIIGLEERGFRFTIISFEKNDRYPTGKQAVEGMINDRRIKWIPLSYTAKPPVISTLWDIRRLKKTVERIHTADPVHLVHCRSYITALAGMELKKKAKIPFLFDMRGFYPDERADAGLWPKDHPLYGAVYRYFKSKEKDFLAAADYSVVLTHAGECLMREGKLTGSAFTGPLQVIPCCADFSVFDFRRISSEQKVALKNELNISEKTFILGYSGSLGTWYMLPEMMDFFARLLIQNPESVFLFLTRDDPDPIFREADRLSIPHDRIRVRSCTREEMPLGVSLFDASLFFILPSFSKQASSPTKQGELMGMGIPVICNTGVGDVRKIVEDCDSGVVVDAFNHERYDRALKEFQERNFDAGKIRREGERVYGLSEGVNRYAGIYSALVLLS